MTSDSLRLTGVRRRFCRFATSLVASLVLALLNSPSSTAQEDTAEPDVDLKSQRVIADYIEAMGGEMRIDSIESFNVKGQYGTEGSMSDFELLVVGEDCILSYGGATRIVGTRLHKWSEQSGGESSLDSTVRYQETFPLLTIVYYWPNYHGKISHVGEEEMDGRAVDVLLFQGYGRKPLKRFFDKQSGLMVAQHVNNFFQRFEYTELEDLQVIKRQVLYNAQGKVHQIMEYGTTLDVEFEADHFDLPDSIKDELETSRKEREEKGVVEPGPDDFQIYDGDQVKFRR